MQMHEVLAIRELLRYQHVVGAVVCLGERPMRYGELGNSITEWAGSRVSDGEITRTVHRLKQSNLAKDSYVDGYRLLALTEDGRRRLEAYGALGDAVRDCINDVSNLLNERA